MNLAGAGYAKAGTRAWASGHLYGLEHTVRAPLAVTSKLSHRVRSPFGVFRPMSSKVSNVYDVLSLSHRVTMPRAHHAELLHRMEADGPVFRTGDTLPPSFPVRCMPPTLVGRSRWDAAWQLRLSNLEIQCKAGINASVDLTGIPYRLQISHQRSAASTWSWYIVDDLGIYHPNKVGGPYEGVLGRTKDHRMKAIVRWGDREFIYTGPAAGFGHQRSNRDGWFRDAVWSGIDESKPLFERSVTMPTVRSTRRRVQYAAPVANEIVSAAGLSLSGFRDFPLRLMHRQDGRYGDWLMRLLEVSGQQWRMRGKIVDCYDSLDGHGPVFTYSGSSVVISESYDSALAEVLTRVVVSRLVERDVESAEEPEVATTFGKYTKSFSQPMNAVKATVLVSNGGEFSDFIGRNQDGNVVAVWGIKGGIWPSHLHGAPRNNIVSVEYTFGAKRGVVANEGYGEILFAGASGDKVDEEDLPAEFDGDLVSEIFDAELESLFGVVKEEMTINELIATAAQAESFGRGHLNKLKAALFPLRVTVPLNPALVDGSRVRLVDATLGTTLERIVISATHTFDADPSQCTTVFTCGGYL